jgi:hypothetical protein
MHKHSSWSWLKTIMIIGVSDWRHFLAHKSIYIKIVEYGYDEPNSKEVEDSLQKAHK